MKVLIVGNRGGTNVGGCFERAAQQLGHSTRLLESRQATCAAPWLRRINWHLRGRRPTHLGRFSELVRKSCVDWKPDLVLATGFAPITEPVLRRIRAEGVAVLNYLTDDPWNTAQHAPWFLRALPAYAGILSPRRSNLRDLCDVGCETVNYLPFAYDPMLHFPAEPNSDSKGSDYNVLFIGGADRDRVPFCAAMVESGIRVALYGDYWGRYSQTRRCYRGYANVETMREVTSRAPVCLCLVRRANRDGHTMRSFEIPAMGGCMLTEDTEEHREIFGSDGECVIYFRSISEMVDRAKWLLAHPDERRRLAAAVYARITQGKHTYADRLQTMLQIAGHH